MSFISFDNIVKILTKYWDKFLIDGVGYTLLLSAITVFFGAILASLLAGMKMSRIAPLRWLSAAYIEIIRGTPMLLQLYFFYFALPSLIPRLSQVPVLQYWAYGQRRAVSFLPPLSSRRSGTRYELCRQRRSFPRRRPYSP